MKLEPAYDPAIDYEPPYDLEAAHARNLHAYRTSPNFQKFLNELWAKAEDTTRSWREANERESQMRLPLREFCAWMWFERGNPYAEPEENLDAESQVKGENL